MFGGSLATSTRAVEPSAAPSPHRWMSATSREGRRHDGRHGGFPDRAERRPIRREAAASLCRRVVTSSAPISRCRRTSRWKASSPLRPRRRGAATLPMASPNWPAACCSPSRARARPMARRSSSSAQCHAQGHRGLLSRANGHQSADRLSVDVSSSLHGADNCSIIDVLLVNPYQAVDFGGRATGRHLHSQSLRCPALSRAVHRSLPRRGPRGKRPLLAVLGRDRPGG